MSVTLAPITDADLPEVGAFLHTHLNNRVAQQAWADAARLPWPAWTDERGVLLREGGGDGPVVGAYLAFPSERVLDGRSEQVLNLGAWCVLPQHRFQGLRLLRALLARPGVHVTDMSPSGPVVALNERLGFVHLDTASTLVANLPWPPLPGDTRVSGDPRRIEAMLTGRELQLYRDHRATAATRHAVLWRGGRACYVAFRRVRRKGLPLFAALLHVGDTELLASSWRPLTRHLLVRHALPLTLAETRLSGPPPAWASRRAPSRPKMIRSPLPAERFEDLVPEMYSELTCLPW